MIIRELIVKLGFNIDSARFEQFQKMTDSLKTKMSSIKEAASNSFSPEVNETFQRLKEASQKMKLYKQELQNFSKEEQADIKELNSLEKQAIKETQKAQREKYKEMKAGAQEAMQQKRRNQQELQNLIKGGQKIAKTITIATGVVAAGFSLGLKSLLNDVRNFKTQKYSGAKSSDKFDKKQIKAVDEFNEALEGSKNIITEIRNSSIIDLLPIISSVIKQFQVWLKTNKELIKQKLKTFIQNIGSAISNTVNIVNSVVKAFGGWQRVMSFVKVAIAAIGIYKFSKSLYIVGQNIKLIKAALKSGFSLKSLFSPITLIAAALTGLFLILEDFYVFSKGGKSIIGDIVSSEPWKKFQAILDKITDSVDKLLIAFGILEDKKAPKLLSTTENGLKIYQVQEGEERHNLQSLVRKKIIPPNSNEHNEEVEESSNKEKTFFKKKKNRLKIPEIFEEFRIEKNPIDSLRESLNIPKNIELSNKLQLDKNLNLSKSSYELATPRSSVVNQKQTYNMTINVPKGTLEQQAVSISHIIREEIEKHTRYSTEQALAAINAV